MQTPKSFVWTVVASIFVTLLTLQIGCNQQSSLVVNDGDQVMVFNVSGMS